MPFTPSHALVALPFVRTPLVPAAIAVGAMTPDLPLFLRGIGPSYAFTHSAANIVWTTLIAAALLLVWRTVLRPASVALAPALIAARLPREWRTTGMRAVRDALGAGRLSGAALLIASLALGVLSHIVWDLFTHEGRWGVSAVPVLEQMWGPLAGYKWLQHGSSVIGLLGLGLFALRWMRRRRATAVTAARISAAVRIGWYLSLPIVLLGAWIVGLAAYGPLTPEFTVQHLAYRTLPPACGIWGALTLALCAVIAFRGSADARAVTTPRGLDPRDAVR